MTNVGFIENNGTYTTISYPGATGTVTYGINNTGEIVGAYQDSLSSPWQSFLDVDGAFTSISVPGANATTVYAINNNGEVGGYYADSSGKDHGFTELNGIYTTIDFPGATQTLINGINDAGEVVGLAVIGTGTEEGFSYYDGTFTAILDPNSINIDVVDGSQTSSWAHGINNSGDIVGFYLDSSAVSHGFIYSDGEYTDIDVEGATFTQAYGINNEGQIVGTFGSSDGTFGVSPYGFVATPTNTAPCYLRGTLIATPTGERLVESLAAADLVLTTSGLAQSVIRTGHRRLDCRRHPRPASVWPVRVRAEAFGDRLPHSDLWLSPDHAVFVDGVLIPIRHLINNTTVTQEPWDEVDYWHIELAHHDILRAEGLPAESYLDTGRLSFFASDGTVTILHPDLEPHPDDQLLWESLSYAPLVVTGPILESVRERLALRSAALTRRALRAA